MITPSLRAVPDRLCERAVGHDPLEAEAVAARLLCLGGAGFPRGPVTRRRRHRSCAAGHQ